MHKLAMVATAVSMMFGAGAAVAETYPSRPITMIAPFAAGGPTDALARILAERMRRPLGQPIIIENVTGAGGTTGVARAVRAPADGYAISIGHLATHVVNGAIYPLQFDLIGDLDPIGLIGANPMMIVSKNAVPAKNLRELVAWIKSKDGNVMAGTAGVGSGAHFTAVYFKNLIGAELQFVPYRGTGPALQDLVAGQIDLIVDQASNSMAQVQQGNIRAYAVSSDKRLPSLPNVPTAIEEGIDFRVDLWYGMWAPKGTPKDVVASLNAALVEALADATVVNRLNELGIDIYPRAKQTPEELYAFQRAEAGKWWPIIKAAKITVN
jgi:tripartite-type tricarboxylate transporter receptor subunit TctC